MRYNTLDINIAIVARTPQFNQNEAAGTAMRLVCSIHGSGQVRPWIGNIRWRIKLDANHTLLPLDEKSRMRLHYFGPAAPASPAGSGWRGRDWVDEARLALAPFIRPASSHSPDTSLELDAAAVEDAHAAARGAFFVLFVLACAFVAVRAEEVFFLDSLEFGDGGALVVFAFQEDAVFGVLVVIGCYPELGLRIRCVSVCTLIVRGRL